MTYLPRLAVVIGPALAVGLAFGQRQATAAPPLAEGEIAKAERPAKGTALLLIEPRKMRPEVSVLVPGARETVFSAAYQGALGARPFTKDAFREAYPEGWKAFFSEAKEAAAEHLKSLKPRLVRDRNKVIQYALLQSDHILTPTVVLAPQFAKMFTETLGNQLLIAIPDRSTVVVFPKLAGGIESHYAGLNDLFTDAIFPVSEEFFELTKDGIRAVGAFRAD